MARKILIQGTHGKEDSEKATLPFIVGDNAVAADQEAIVFLTSDAVWLATKGYADEIPAKEGLRPLKDVLASFVANGGAVWACGACTKPRGITDQHLITGAKIVTAANVVEALAGGAATLSF